MVTVETTATFLCHCMFRYSLSFLLRVSRRWGGVLTVFRVFMCRRADCFVNQGGIVFHTHIAHGKIGTCWINIRFKVSLLCEKNWGDQTFFGWLFCSRLATFFFTVLCKKRRGREEERESGAVYAYAWNVLICKHYRKMMKVSTSSFDM